MNDIQNKAEYSTSGMGLNYKYTPNFDKADDATRNKEYKEQGLTPNIPISASGKSASTTKSAVTEGSLKVLDGKIDSATVERNTQNTVHTLATIFDKKKLEERQALAYEFSKNANEAIHRISEANKWEDGDPRKVALHAAVGAVSAELGGGDATIGGVSGAVNEAAVKKIIQTVGTNHPDLAQLLSAALGYATDKVLGGNGQTGASVSSMGTKWNLELDAHAANKRWKEYTDFLGSFDEEYTKDKKKGDSGDKSGDQALNDLTYVANNAESFGLTPIASELLSLFLKQNFDEHGIDHVENTKEGLKVAVFGASSILNEKLRNDDGLNQQLILEAMSKMNSSGVEMPTYTSSTSLYLRGGDYALGIGSGGAITTHHINSDNTVDAEITIIDYYNFADAVGGFYKDAYIVQQTGKRDTFVWKTTYSVHYTMAELLQH